MTYQPISYWLEQGPTYAARFRPGRYQEQEAALRAEFASLEAPRSVLDVGCGFGRIGTIVHEVWPDVRYAGLDVSSDQLAAARSRLPEGEFVEASLAAFRPGFRRWDLVIAVEFLMHVPPEDAPYAVQKLVTLARRALVTCDWTVPVDGPIAEHNFLHGYHDLFREAGVEMVGTRDVGQQTIFEVLR